MTAASERQRRVAASFTRQYYTLMVQQPEKLPAFYTPHATFDHMGHKAEGIAEIETTIAALYPVQPNGSAQIHSLSVETTANGNTHVTIKGSITTALNVTYNFAHYVELTEHRTEPGSFGIVNDKRERTIQEEALQRWALETPPMFAQESRKDAMEPIEQPAATTAVRALEKSPSKKSVEPLKKAESPASEKVAVVNSTVRESSATVTAAPVSPDSCVAASATDATLETVTDKKLEEEGTTTTPMPSTSATNTEPKKPKSFAEAIMMGKRNAGAQGHATPLKVVARGGKEQSTEEPVKEKKEKNRDSAAVAEKNGTKGVHRNVTNVKKPSTATTSAEGEKKNGRPNAVGGNGKEGGSNTNNNTITTTKNNNNHNNNHNNNNNNKNNKRKDAEGRTLSRFVVFYDIIVKGLPHDATEETVRDIIGTSAPVKLVNIRSQPDRKDPGVLRTFAFVQLDHNALKEAGDDVKETVAKIVSVHKGKKGPAGQRYQIDEVREKYTAVPAEASA
ncbi:Nuclear transport factor 2 [Trypanosoma melophagium]|uniref:Nuclear transport factor 2 n=1 Tax=Trypanosoma melophagium TaxID=715481 RepID=UPI00351A37F5|nr:Nuclear transport factor 2 [Trypanosoma melophagium]